MRLYDRINKRKTSVRPMTMETRYCQKKNKIPAPEDLCTARYEHKSSEQKFPTFKRNRKKNITGPIFKIGLRKT